MSAWTNKTTAPLCGGSAENAAGSGLFARPLNCGEDPADSRADFPANVGCGKRWYVIHAQPHGELRAIDHLQRQGFKTFCPCTRKLVRHARRQTAALAPLFPNYLFVELNLDRDHWRSVNGTRGVVRLIANGDNPAAVPPGVVEALQARMNADGAIDWTSSLKIGDRVRISEGPFASLLGTLEHLDTSGRVRVLLELLGRSVCVALRGEALLPAA